MTAERRRAITLKLLKPAWTPQWKRVLLLNNGHSQQWKTAAGTFFFSVSSVRAFYHKLFIALCERLGTVASRVDTCKFKRACEVHEDTHQRAVLQFWSQTDSCTPFQWGDIDTKYKWWCTQQMHYSVTLKYPWKNNNKQASSMACKQ